MTYTSMYSRVCCLAVVLGALTFAGCENQKPDSSEQAEKVEGDIADPRDDEAKPQKATRADAAKKSAEPEKPSSAPDVAADAPDNPPPSTASTEDELNRAAAFFVQPAGATVAVKGTGLQDLLKKLETHDLLPARQLDDITSRNPLVPLVLEPPDAGSDPSRPMLASIYEVPVEVFVPGIRMQGIETQRMSLPAAADGLDTHFDAAVAALVARSKGEAVPANELCGAFDCTRVKATPTQYVVVKRDDDVFVYALTSGGYETQPEAVEKALAEGLSSALDASAPRLTPALAAALAPEEVAFHFNHEAAAAALVMSLMKDAFKAANTATPDKRIEMLARGFALIVGGDLWMSSEVPEIEDTTVLIGDDGVEAIHSLTETGVVLRAATTPALAWKGSGELAVDITVTTPGPEALKNLPTAKLDGRERFPRLLKSMGLQGFLLAFSRPWTSPLIDLVPLPNSNDISSMRVVVPSDGGYVALAMVMSDASSRDALVSEVGKLGDEWAAASADLGGPAAILVSRLAASATIPSDPSTLFDKATSDTPAFSMHLGPRDNGPLKEMLPAMVPPFHWTRAIEGPVMVDRLVSWDAETALATVPPLPDGFEPIGDSSIPRMCHRDQVKALAEFFVALQSISPDQRSTSIAELFKQGLPECTDVGRSREFRANLMRTGLEVIDEAWRGPGDGTSTESSADAATAEPPAPTEPEEAAASPEPAAVSALCKDVAKSVDSFSDNCKALGKRLVRNENAAKVSFAALKQADEASLGQCKASLAGLKACSGEKDVQRLVDALK